MIPTRTASSLSSNPCTGGTADGTPETGALTKGCWQSFLLKGEAGRGAGARGLVDVALLFPIEL